MSRPAIAGLIERRLLINFRLDPQAAAAVVPPGTRPLLRRGHAVGGIGLIRLAGLRRSGGPALPVLGSLAGLADVAGRFGLRTEIAVHRICILRDGPDGPEHGLYIPRRDTDSRITTLTSGLFLPGEHHLAKFEAEESPDRLRISFRSTDGAAHARVETLVTDRLRGSVLFSDLDDAAAFLRQTPDGYSDPGECSLRPATLLDVSSSYFEDPRFFPPGTAQPDSALLLRDVETARHTSSARTAHRPARAAVHPI